MAKVLGNHEHVVSYGSEQDPNKWMTGHVVECINHSPPVLFEIEAGDPQRYTNDGRTGVTNCPVCNRPITLSKDIGGHVHDKQEK